MSNIALDSKLNIHAAGAAWRPKMNHEAVHSGGILRKRIFLLQLPVDFLRAASLLATKRA